MGYYLQAIIAPTAALQASAVPGSRGVLLECGLSILPLGEETLEELDIPYFAIDLEGMSTLSGPLLELCSVLSKETRLIYVEVAFHGGPPGVQAYIPFESGRMLGAARISNDFGPVSEGLRFLGVKKGGAYDEFERVGLDRYKHTKDWLNAANA